MYTLSKGWTFTIVGDNVKVSVEPSSVYHYISKTFHVILRKQSSLLESIYLTLYYISKKTIIDRNHFLSKKIEPKYNGRGYHLF